MDNKLDKLIERAAGSYKKSDDGRWVAAYWSSKVVGTYAIGGTLELSKRMGCSTDTVENLAHAYMLYNDLRADPRYRQTTRAIRKMPYIYYSYFRALYKAREDYSLSLEQIHDLLVDILQAEGGLHLSSLENHIRDRFGDTRDWRFYGTTALKHIGKLLQQPDIPDDVKAVLIPAFEVLGEQA